MINDNPSECAVDTVTDVMIAVIRKGQKVSQMHYVMKALSSVSIAYGSRPLLGKPRDNTSPNAIKGERRMVLWIRCLPSSTTRFAR